MPTKKQLFTVDYAITNYQEASELIMKMARSRISFGVSALAVHGLIETVRDPNFRQTIRNMNIVVPDGQPIKWALNSFYKTGLKERVAGPTLTKHVLFLADVEELNVYLYGSTSSTLEKFQAFISYNYPNVKIVGIHKDRFREATSEERLEDIAKINASGAHIVLVGRGCPRQEKWIDSNLGHVNAVMLAVGAAFDFHAGNIKHAPAWMQNSGFEWLFRLAQDPKKLWKRYLITNSYFIYLFILCKLRFKKVDFS